MVDAEFHGTFDDPAVGFDTAYDTETYFTVSCIHPLHAGVLDVFVVLKLIKVGIRFVKKLLPIFLDL